MMLSLLIYADEIISLFFYFRIKKKLLSGIGSEYLAGVFKRYVRISVCKSYTGSKD